jgi:hypothetical protein
MKLLTRDDILTKLDRVTTDVEVPEWNGTIRLGSISADTLLKFRDLQNRKEKGEDVESEMVGVVLAGSILNEENVEIFTRENIPQLMRKNPEVIMRLFVKSMELNNLTPPKLPDGTQTTPVEEARKNS